MAEVKPLSEFFSAIEKDCRISITHIGIYAALLQYWDEHNCEYPILAFSHDIMKLAKISGSSTYHKCMRELNEYGYIKYIASYKRTEGSKIYIPYLKEDT